MVYMPRNKNTPHDNQGQIRGFTIVELLIVIV